MKSQLGKMAVAVLLVVFCVAAATGFVVGDAYALPPNEVETYYYSDATYSTEIGWRLLLCSGQSYSSGQTSIYRVTYSTPCW